MGGAVTEEQAISYAQYLDFLYSQSVTLYDLIPHAPHPTTDPSRPTTEPPTDGILGSVQVLVQPTNKASSKGVPTLSMPNQCNLPEHRP